MGRYVKVSCWLALLLFLVGIQPAWGQDCRGLPLYRGESGLTGNLETSEFANHGRLTYDHWSSSGFAWGVGAGIIDHRNFTQPGFSASIRLGHDFSEAGSPMSLCPAYQGMVTGWLEKNVIKQTETITFTNTSAIILQEHTFELGFGAPLQVGAGRNVMVAPYVVPFVEIASADTQLPGLALETESHTRWGARGGVSFRVAHFTSYIGLAWGTQDFHTLFNLGVGLAF